MARARATIVTAFAALAGCSGVGTQLSPLGEDLGKQAGAIVVGESDRESVRALPGSPWLATDHWRFDLFRSTDRDSAVFYVAFIPVARASQDVRGFVLVTYGTDGKVTAFDTGVARSGNILGPATLQPAILGAGGLQVTVDDQDPVMLPPHSGKFRPSLLPVELKPGNHTLRSRWDRARRAGSSGRRTRLI